jgi:hypothetical protein
MSNTKPSKATLSQGIRSLIAGTQKNAPNGSFTFGGVTYTAATLDQLFQSLIDALSAADAAKAAWKAALSKAQGVRANVLPVVRGYKALLLATDGNAPDVLADYGLTPRKARAPLSTDAQAVANAKSKATREARHTMGSVEKKSVKGNVTSVTVTPVTSTPTVTPPGSAATLAK